MKATLLPCALVALAMFGLHRWEVARLQGDLAAARDDARVTASRRVPRTELTKAHAAVAAAQEETSAVERELAATREQLATAQAATRLAELHPAGGPAAGGAAEAAPAPDLVKGSFTLLDDTRVYSPDAQLKVGRNVLISSPSGLMLSDKEVDQVAGDLAVETSDGTMQATNAFIDVNGGKIQLNADTVTFTSK